MFFLVLQRIIHWWVMDSTKQQPLLSMKLSLDWRSLGIGVIKLIMNITWTFVFSFLFFWSPQSLQRSPISLQFIIYIVNMTVGVTGAVLYTIFSETNNSFGTEKKAFIAICYVAFECFMMLILFLLAVAQWHKYLRLWQEVIFNSFDMHCH